MRRLLLVIAAAALLLPAAASAWEGVEVEVTVPERVTAGQISILDFHVSLGGKPLDLATVGPGIPGLRPMVVFTKGARHVTVTARPTGRRGVYRVRVVLPSVGGLVVSLRVRGPRAGLSASRRTRLATIGQRSGSGPKRCATNET
jgi:hypothetical protein